jgi:hypothetical protein
MKRTVFKRTVFVAGLLAVACAAAMPARADYAVIQFGDGYCQIWQDGAETPWGTGWTKIAIGLPDHFAARAALDSAIWQGVCH